MILVTGATGNVGRALVRRLSVAGHQLRVLTRDSAKAERLIRTSDIDVDVAVGDLDDRSSLPSVMDGVGRVFLMGQGPQMARQVDNLTRVAADGGVQHVVLLSSLSVELSRGGVIARWHSDAEHVLRESTLPWTVLRPGVFTSNTLQWADSIRSAGKVRSMTGDHPVAPIDPDDVASVAATVLLSPGHNGLSYALTGPERTTPSAQTRVLSELLGRDLVFEAIPARDAVRSMMDFGISRAEAEETVSSLRQDDGAFATPLATVEELTGHPPRTFRQWAIAQLDAFLDGPQRSGVPAAT